jgi:hypothetical protein
VRITTFQPGQFRSVRGLNVAERRFRHLNVSNLNRAIACAYSIAGMRRLAASQKVRAMHHALVPIIYRISSRSHRPIRQFLAAGAEIYRRADVSPFERRRIPSIFDCSTEF